MGQAHLRGRRAGLAVVSLVWLSLGLGACGGEAEPLKLAANSPDVSVSTAPTTTNAALKSTTASTANNPTSVATTPTMPETSSAVTSPPLGSPEAGAGVSPLPTKVTPGQLLPFVAENAYQHVKELAGTIGIRAAGTPNAQKASLYIRQQFAAAGLRTELGESNYAVTHDTGSSLTLPDDPASPPLKLYPLTVSSSTSTQVEGEIVLLSANTDEKSVAGKIVLLDPQLPDYNTLSQKIIGPHLNEIRAILVIAYQSQPLAAANLSGGSNLAYVEHTGGQKLAQKAAQNTFKVRLDFKLETQQLNIRNVIATRPATGAVAAPAPIVIIGGHYDSVPTGPGANDNASGTGTVLELARVLAKAYPEVEFRFVAFDGEEIGLVGSREYVARLNGLERGRVLGMVNIDMISVGQSLRVTASQNLAALARAALSELSMPEVSIELVASRSGGGSDYASFKDVGLNVLSFGRYNDPNYHQPGDTPDKFTAQPLGQVGQIVLATLHRLLTA